MYIADYVDHFLEVLDLASGYSSATFMANIAYHIWLTRNNIIFNSASYSARIIMERAWIYAYEYLMSTVVLSRCFSSALLGFCLLGAPISDFFHS